MPKASVLTGYGPPDVLVWKETAMPQPGAGQLRIRVRAAGVSPTDLKIRRGDLQAVFLLPSASGALRLRAQRQIPIERAAEAHALLDNGEAHEKLILTVE